MSPDELLHPRRALLSVHDKTNIVRFAQGLREYGVEILSSGGTAQVLSDHGVEVTEVSDYTGAAEMMSGRVKTLHPRIHGGILGRRPTRTGPRLVKEPDDRIEMEHHDIPPIDIVCVNLYPFEKTVSRADVTLQEALEDIDIGGPTLIRAAGKNFPSVCVVTHPDQYHEVLMALKEHGGIPCTMRERFARVAFHHTALYDAAIAHFFRGLPATEGEDWVQERLLPPGLPLALAKVRDLRYGENPHQRGAYYRLDGDRGDYLTDSQILQGKEISYNNLLDIDAVVRICREFPGKTCAVVVKHQNPTGVAVASTAAEAYQLARGVDETAAFGNVTGISSVVDEEAAKVIVEAFVEVVVAVDFTQEAREILRKKKNLRLVKTNLVLPVDLSGRLEGRALIHGVLVQEIDTALWDEEKFKVASKRGPTDEEMAAMELGWRVVKHVRSNATVLANSVQTLGTGSGMTARVDSFRHAIEKAGNRARGAVAATDGFCFPDSVELSNEAGITAIIEPGGGVQDEAVIEKADELGMALIMTGMRHFKH